MTKTITKNILLVHSSFKDYAFGKKWEENPSLTPPLGLLYLGTPLLKAGHNVTYTDLNIDKYTEEKFFDLIKQQDFILISCYTDTMPNTRALIQDIRKQSPDTIVMCGGPYLYMNEKLIEGSHYTCVGEAENYIAPLIEAIIRGENLDTFPGVFYEQEDKTIKRTPGMMIAEDLNASLPPALELAKGKNYGSLSGLKLDISSVVSTRGCPFDCTYCTHKGRIKYRERTVENVVAEIKDVISRGNKYIFFGDDNFLLNRKRAIKLMDEIIRQKLKVRMIIQGRVDSADEELYKKLRKAGVVMIMFGIENANQDVLDYYKKKISVDQIKKAITMADKVGILSFGYYIIGSELETHTHFENLKQHFDDVPLDVMIMGVLFYIMGAKIWDDILDRGIIQKHEESFMANEKVANFTSKELLHIKDDLVKYFYTNPRRILRMLWKVVKLGCADLVINWLITGSFLKFINFMKHPYDLLQKSED